MWSPWPGPTTAAYRAPDGAAVTRTFPPGCGSHGMHLPFVVSAHTVAVPQVRQRPSCMAGPLWAAQHRRERVDRLGVERVGERPDAVVQAVAPSLLEPGVVVAQPAAGAALRRGAVER